MRKLIIDEAIRKNIKRVQYEHNYKKEIGGILVGLYDAEMDTFQITDMSFPLKSDRKYRFRFLRKNIGHQQFMDDLWEKSGHKKAYLGEWHTHDQDTPYPSFMDLKTWERISEQNVNFDTCFFLIIGRRRFIIWTVEKDKVYEVEKG